MKTLRKELPLLLLSLLPPFYLLVVWNRIPQNVAMHYDLHGNVDRYGSKSELVWLSVLLPLLCYFLLMALPSIDPKRKIEGMGNKFWQLRFILGIFITGLMVFVVYSSQYSVSMKPNIVIGGIGLLFTALGNYFKTIRPNYFLGIRTPWTLESDVVWKETHRVAGILWFFGGLLVAVFSVILSNPELLFYIFIIIMVFLVVIPFAYSYTKFRQVKSKML
ncbi:MAG: hypothetical protein BGO40_04660 [Chryseobacterium sp. 39-10]|nr:SdpI family protein [Chryseobacterium sp.]OJV47188.1 MAG: hypothetical protein BGO40_04660 [Chryseobacterium sp. 39-10]